MTDLGQSVDPPKLTPAIDRVRLVALVEAFEDAAREDAVRRRTAWMRRDPDQSAAGLTAVLAEFGIEVNG